MHFVKSQMYLRMILAAKSSKKVWLTSIFMYGCSGMLNGCFFPRANTSFLKFAQFSLVGADGVSIKTERQARSSVPDTSDISTFVRQYCKCLLGSYTSSFSTAMTMWSPVSTRFFSCMTRAKSTNA